MNAKKFYNLFCFIIISVVFIIGIAYSALQTNLAINDINCTI